jgi:hypothetical protein
MADTQGFNVHHPTLDAVQQHLLDGHASLTATVQDTAEGCTSAASAYPSWATSNVVTRLHAAHAEKVTGHALELADYHVRVQLSCRSYRCAEDAWGSSADLVARQV